MRSTHLVLLLVALAAECRAAPAGGQPPGMVWVVSLPAGPAGPAAQQPLQSAQVVDETRPVEAAVNSVVEGLKSILRSDDGPHPAPLADLAVTPVAESLAEQVGAAPSDINELAVGPAWDSQQETEVLEAIPSPDTTLVSLDQHNATQQDGPQEPVPQDVLKEPLQQDVPQESVQQDVPQESVQQDVPHEPAQQDVAQEPVQQNVPHEPVQQAVPQEPVQQDVSQEPVQQVVPQDPLQQNVPLEPVQQDVPKEPVKQDVPQEPLQQDVPQESVQQNVPQEPVQQDVPQKPVQQDVPQDPLQQDVPQEPVQQDVPQEPVQQNVPQEPLQQELPQEIAHPDFSKELVKQEPVHQVLPQEPAQVDPQQAVPEIVLKQELTQEAFQQKLTSVPLEQENSQTATVPEMSPQAPSQQDNPQLLIQEGAPAVSAQQDIPRDTPQLPIQDVVSEVGAQQNIPQSPTQQDTPQLPIQEAAPEASAQQDIPQDIPQLPIQEAAPEVSAQQDIPQDTPQLPVQEVAPEVSSQQDISQDTPQLAVQEAAPEVNAQQDIPQDTPQLPVQEVAPEVSSQQDISQDTPQLAVQEAAPEVNAQQDIPQDTPQLPVQEVAPEVSAQQDIPQAPTQQDIPQIPIQEAVPAVSIPQLPIEDVAPELSVQQDIPQLPIKEVAPELSVQQDILQTPTQQDTPQLPIQEAAPEVMPQQDISQSPTQQDTLQTPIQEAAPEVMPQQDLSKAPTQQDTAEVSAQQDLVEAPIQPPALQDPQQSSMDLPPATLQQSIPHVTQDEQAPPVRDQVISPETSLSPTADVAQQVSPVFGSGPQPVLQSAEEVAALNAQLLAEPAHTLPDEQSLPAAPPAPPAADSSAASAELIAAVNHELLEAAGGGGVLVEEDDLEPSAAGELANTKPSEIHAQAAQINMDLSPPAEQPVVSEAVLAAAAPAASTGHLPVNLDPVAAPPTDALVEADTEREDVPATKSPAATSEVAAPVQDAPTTDVASESGNQAPLAAPAELQLPQDGEALQAEEPELTTAAVIPEIPEPSSDVTSQLSIPELPLDVVSQDVVPDVTEVPAQDELQDLPEDKPTDKPEDKPGDMIEDKPAGKPDDKVEDTVIDMSQSKPVTEIQGDSLDKLQEELEVSPPEMSQDLLQDVPQTLTNDAPQTTLLDLPQDTTQTPPDSLSNAPQNVPLDNPELEIQSVPALVPGMPQDASQEAAQVAPQATTQEVPQNTPQEEPQNVSQDVPLETIQNAAPIVTQEEQSAPQEMAEEALQAAPQDVPQDVPQTEDEDNVTTEAIQEQWTEGPIVTTHDLAGVQGSAIESIAPAAPTTSDDLTQSDTTIMPKDPLAEPEAPDTTTTLPGTTVLTDAPVESLAAEPGASVDLPVLPTATEIDEVPTPETTPAPTPAPTPVPEPASEDAVATPAVPPEETATTSGADAGETTYQTTQAIVTTVSDIVQPVEQASDGIKSPGEPFLNPDDPDTKPATEEESNAILEETEAISEEGDKSDETNQIAESNPSSEQQNNSAEEINQSTEQQNNSSEEINQSTEQQNNSSEETNQSSEQQNSSSEETNQSSEQQNSSSEEINQSSEQQNNSPEEANLSSEHQNNSSVEINESNEQPNYKPEVPSEASPISPAAINEALTEPTKPSSDKQPVAVRWLRVRSEVQLRFAHTAVRAALHNPAPHAQEVQLSLTLPETGYVTGLSLECGGKVYKAYVRERRKADGEYQQAALSGQTTAQVRQTSARDSSVVSLLVTVAARAELTVNMTYEELLGRRRGQYHHTISVDPGQDVEDVKVDVVILESRNLTSLAVTAAGQKLYSVDQRELSQHGLQNYSSGPLSVRRPGGNAAHLQVSQQLQLQPAALTVTYDVDRSQSASGDLLLLDGYFVHFFAPLEVPPLRKHAIFVLDTSGSMWGHKLKQLQAAMNRILDSLHPDDFFSIVQFSSHVTEWSPHTLEVVGLRDKEATLPANKDHINKAKKFINGMEASGGTNIGGALRSAVRLAGKRDYDRWPTYRAGSADRPQPIIIFLTDGLPTVGTLSLGRVLAQTRAQNAEIKAAIFSLSFGTRSNWRFLQRLSLQNDGFARRIYEAGDAAQQLQDFYQEIASPLLANVTFNYVTAKVDGATVTRRSFPLLYGGGELVVAGRVADGVRSLEAEVEVWGAAPGASAAVGAAPGRRLLRAEAVDPTGLTPPPPPGKKKPEPKPTIGILERLWAYLSVKQLLDVDLMKHEDDVIEEPPKTEPGLDQPRRRALYLALKYGFVTRVSSLVVVQPAANNSLQEAAVRPAPADGAERDAENLTGNNKFSELSLTRPGPGHVPMSFKPLLFSQQAENQSQSLPLTAISWLSQHTDSAGRLRLGPVSFSLELPPKQDIQRLMSAAANQCPGRTCKPLASCVQPAVAASFMVFRDFFCPLGMYAGVCCSL